MEVLTDDFQVWLSHPITKSVGLTLAVIFVSHVLTNAGAKMLGIVEEN